MSRVSSNKQLQRTVIPNRLRRASASFHYALAPRIPRQRAAAELRRYAAQVGSSKGMVAHGRSTAWEKR
jgi:hypothetical protein